MAKNVKDLMTSNPRSIDSEKSVAYAAKMMRDENVGLAPIVRGDQLVGTVTDRDITIRHVADGQNPYRVKARDIMTPNVFYCFVDQDVEEVGRYMQEHEVRRVLIFDRGQNLVGVVSLGDISKAAGEERLAGETLKEIAEAA